MQGGKGRNPGIPKYTQSVKREQSVSAGETGRGRQSFCEVRPLGPEVLSQFTRQKSGKGLWSEAATGTWT